MIYYCTALRYCSSGSRDEDDRALEPSQFRSSVPERSPRASSQEARRAVSAGVRTCARGGTRTCCRRSVRVSGRTTSALGAVHQKRLSDQRADERNSPGARRRCPVSPRVPGRPCRRRSETRTCSGCGTTALALPVAGVVAKGAAEGVGGVRGRHRTPVKAVVALGQTGFRRMSGRR